MLNEYSYLNNESSFLMLNAFHGNERKSLMLQSKIQGFQLDCIDCNETKAPLTMRLQLI